MSGLRYTEVCVVCSEVAASSREVLRVFDILLRRGNWGVNLVIGPPVAAKGAPPQCE